ITADVHLVTLRDQFVGYVLPSKIHACIESGKRVLFVGSERSDVHRLATTSMPAGRYSRIDTGKGDGLVAALKSAEIAIGSETQSGRCAAEKKSMAPPFDARRPKRWQATM